MYTLGISGIVSAFEALSGRRVWQAAPPAAQPFFGTASSPAADGNLVFVHTGNYDGLTAFDADSGAVVWRADGTFSYASPVVVALGGVRQIVSVTQERVVGLSLSGTRLWEHPFESPHVYAITPIADGEQIIVSAQNMGITALRPHRRDDGSAAEVIWENQDVSTFLSNPVLLDGTLFGLSERMSGQLFALDAGTGATKWLGPPRAAENTAFVKADSLLFQLNQDGELIVTRAGPTGLEPITRYTVATSATWAQPAISGNRVFVKEVASLTLWTLD